MMKVIHDVLKPLVSITSFNWFNTFDLKFKKESLWAYRQTDNYNCTIICLGGSELSLALC